MTRRRGVRLLALGAACAAMLAACARALPEPESPAAILYAARCGGCHYPHPPSLMTPTMWVYQFDRMEQKHRAVASNLPPTSPEEREQILAYLKKHAQQ